MDSMIGPIIAALISLVGVIYSTRRTVKVVVENAPVQASRAPSPARETRRWSILKYGSLLLLTISVAFLGRDIAAKLSSEAQVTVNPIGPLVGQAEIISGTATKLPPGSVVWIVIRSLTVNRLYPQNDLVEMLPGNKWSSLVVFGTERDAGNKFEVLVTIADEHAQRQFREYLAHAGGLPESEGIGSLPPGAFTQTHFVVTRK